MPFKNAESVRQLFEALTLPKEACISKVQAHTKETTFEATGNKLANKVAKATALLPLPEKRAYVTSQQAEPIHLQLFKQARPVTTANAKNIAKILLSEVMCRFGVPETAESNRGTYFTEK